MEEEALLLVEVAAPLPFLPLLPFRIAARLFGFRTLSLRMSQKRSLAMCSCFFFFFFFFFFSEK